MELIKIDKRNINGDLIDTVDAKELHAFLEVKSDFSHWIKGRIKKYDFIHSIDFIDVKIYVQQNQIDRIDYFLTLDMAKEVAMVERNVKGKQAREYFIMMEQKALQKTPAELTRLEILEMAIETEKENIKLKVELKEAQPQIEFAKQVETSINSISVAEYANILSKKGLKIGQNRLFKYFYENGYLMTSSRPYQASLDRGLFEVEEYAYKDHGDNTRTANKVLVTGKGQIHFTRIIETNSVEIKPIQISF